ncbi:MAG: thiamine-phosphate kinase [Burkholderiales bacterium]|nr:thiamine-phosphate kinase [Burkholderiales bacterium]
MTEFELIARYFQRRSPSALVGNGDDCAVIAPTPGHAFAVTTDTLIEGRHFLPTLLPEKLGRRAVHVNLSDLAAMGAQPRFALLSLTLPAIDEGWVAAFSRGLWSALNEFSVELVGGNTTRGALSVSLTAFGEVAPGRALLRSGARSGHDLWVSGPLGDAGWALTALLQDRDGAGQIAVTATTEQIERYESPTARVGLGLDLRGVASSCIDISDGLLSEAGHLATASGVGMDIYLSAIPTGVAQVRYDDVADAAGKLSAHAITTDVHAACRALLAQRCVLHTGDAYELLFTAAPRHRATIEGLFSKHALAGARIGVVTSARPGANVCVLDARGRPLDIEATGWDHFAEVP